MSSGILNEKVVAVLMGGPGAEREVSLRSGAAVARALSTLGAKAVEVDVTGPHFTLPEGVHLAYNMIHGTFGEDGQLQAILEAKGVPYTGEGVEGSRLAFDKIESKRKFDAAGVPTAAFEVLGRGDQPGLIAPYVIKAPRQGSSVGVHIIHDTAHVPAALEDCFQFGDEVLVEDFVKGRELTIGILGGKALPVIEIVPNEGFYDYAHKYTKGASSYYVPAEIGEENTRRVQEAAEAAHKALGLEIYSRVDILLAADGSLSVLEINTIPGMTETSLLPKAAAVVGLDFPALCERIAELSLARHNR
ncbi:D-alanine-D-alanine ligase [Terrimicrobium sacchariphilum]|uniref:D-alanine--D-alanine ligase n=1 Tax=Terrimicrobium sacchariphilum TaxID=690879 RepID=A0A146GBX8_TERSA|nr:D-alanine--D-alanine ligase [Terrimicrobium sacchariphilum]GAT34314.1 D-alanine-D-alanine ligase [Terrimicrobium sacchariphilum]